MKKKLLLISLFLPLSYLNAKMVYLPSHNVFLSGCFYEDTQECDVNDSVDFAEYNKLLNYCMRVIYTNVKSVECNSWEKPDSRKVIQQCCVYLRALIGSETAEILADDFEDGYLYYLSESNFIVVGEIIPKLIKLYNF